MITLGQIIRNQGVTNKVIADALGIESTNIGRYDDLSKRRLSELIITTKEHDWNPGRVKKQHKPGIMPGFNMKISFVSTLFQHQTKTKNINR